MKKISKVCIVCPIGCSLIIEKDSSQPEGYKITGNQCNRGVNYALNEMINPTRVLTSTVKIKGLANIMLPVKTDIAVPKDKMFEIMERLKSIEVEIPIKKEDIVLKNVCNTKVNLIATKSVS